MIYVASPYSDTNPAMMEKRYNDVCRFCATLAELGKFIYSPIAHWHPIAVRYDLPREISYWRESNGNFVMRSNQLYVLMLEGWERSAGVQWEIEFARQHSIRISYFQVLEKGYRKLKEEPNAFNSN